MNKFLIKRPIVTEKAVQMSEGGKYVFLVADEASSPEIRKALKLIYKVDVVKINIINAKAKPKRMGANLYMRPGYRKAIVTLKKGQKLDVLPH